MSTSVELREEPEVLMLPPSRPLDEENWRAWVEKGRARDRRSRAAGLVAVRLVSFAALLVVAGLGSRVTPYGVVAEFVVTAGAIVLMFHAIHLGHYVLAAVFGTLALLYNPVAPVSHLLGEWQRLAIVLSAAPFVASLALRNLRAKRHA